MHFRIVRMRPVCAHAFRRAVATLLASTVICGPAAADSFNWTGASDGDWTNAANWTDVLDGTHHAEPDILNLDIAIVPSGTPSTATIGPGVNATADEVYVGSAAGTAVLLLTGNGTLTTNWLQLGNGVGGSAVLTVSGGASQVDVANQLSVGRAGTGSMTILPGAVVNDGFGAIGYLAGDSGTVVVGGSGAQWNTSQTLRVGFAGTGDLTVQGAAAASAQDVIIGANDTGVGTVTVDTGSTLSATHDLLVGDAGQGALHVASGGVVTVANSTLLGSQNTGVGSISVGGIGSALNITHVLEIGSVGYGEFDVTGGGGVSADRAYIGKIAGATGHLQVAGPGSTWTTAFNLYLGAGGTGTMLAAGGAQVVTGGYAYIGQVAGSSGSATLEDAGSSWHVVNDLVIGGSGTAILTLSNGADLQVDGGIAIATGAGSTGTFNIGADAFSAPAAAGSFTAAIGGISFGAGAGTLNINHTGTAYALSAPITSFDASAVINHLAGHTLFTGAAPAFLGTTNLTGGTLSVNGAGWLGGTTIVSGNGTLGGNGFVYDAVAGSGGKIAPGNSIGTLQVNFATFDAGSVLEVEVDDLGNSDLLQSIGTVTINPGAGVHVAPVNGTDDGSTYTPGQQYTIVNAAFGVTGTFGSVSDSFAFLAPVLTYDANNVFLTLNQDIGFSSIAQTPNQAAAGTGVGGLTTGDPVFDAVLTLSTAEAPAALDALSGEGHASIKGIFVDDASHIRDAAFDRLTAAEDETGGGRHVWSRFYGSTTRIAGDGNAAEAAGNTGGIVFGGDGMAGDMRLGFMANFGATGISVADRATDATSTDYGVGLYGGAEAAGVRFDFGLAHVRHAVSTTRGVSAGAIDETLTADYGASTTQVFGKLSRGFEAGGTTLTPFLSAAHVYHATDGFTETGGVSALTSAASSENATFSTLGFDVGRKLDAAGKPATVKGSLAWQHGFGAQPTAENAYAGSPSFTVAGASLGGDALLAGAALSVDLSATASFDLSYRGRIGDNGQSHALTARLTGQF